MILTILGWVEGLRLPKSVGIWLNNREVNFPFGWKPLQSLSVGGFYGGLLGKTLYGMYFLRTTSLFILALVVGFPDATSFGGCFFG